jgi:hypothetical protein
MKSQRNQSAKEREKEAERAEKWAPMIVEWPKYWNKQRDQTKERFRKVGCARRAIIGCWLLLTMMSLLGIA